MSAEQTAQSTISYEGVQLSLLTDISTKPIEAPVMKRDAGQRPTKKRGGQQIFFFFFTALMWSAVDFLSYGHTRG